MKILVINGPNMNMLGLREPEIYGKKTYADLCGYIESYDYGKAVSFEFFQSNHEGEIIDTIQQAPQKFDAVVINPAAYTHTSIAIADAIACIGIPCVEVHISDPDTREDFRHVSYVRPVCRACFKGDGFDSYIHAVNYLIGNQ